MDTETTGFNPAYAKYDGMTVAQLGRAMEEVREQLDITKARGTELQKEYDFITAVKLPPAMEEQGLTAMKLESGRGVRIQDEVFVSLTQDQFEGFKNWLIEQGDVALVKETINSATLKSYITGRIKAGKTYPAEMVKVTIQPKAQFY